MRGPTSGPDLPAMLEGFALFPSGRLDPCAPMFYRSGCVVGRGGGLLFAEISGTTARLRQNPISGPVWAQDDSTTPPVACCTFSHPTICVPEKAMETKQNQPQALETLRNALELLGMY